MQKQQGNSAISRLWVGGSILAGIIMLAVHGTWGITTLLVAVKDYSPLEGMANSPFVGMMNFQRFFASAAVGPLLRNTVVIGFLTMIFTMLLVVPAVIGIQRVQKVWLRYVLVGISFLPLVMTQPMLLYPVLTHVMTNGVIVRLAIVFYQTVLSAPYLILILVVISHSMKIKESRFCGISALAAIGFGWYVGVCGGQMPRQLLLSPMVYEQADTLLTYVYRTGLMQMNFSHGAVPIMMAGIIGKLGMLVSLILAIVLIPSQPSPQTQGKSSVLTVLVIPTLLVSAIVFFVGVNGVFSDPSAYYPGVSILPSILQLLSPFWGVLLGFLMAGILARGGTFSRIWLALIVFLFAPVGSFSLGEYLSTRAVGGLNVIMPHADMRVSVLFTCIIVGFMCQNANWRKPSRAIFAALSAYLLIFVGIFGDPLTPMIYVIRREYMPASVLQMQLLNMGENPSTLFGGICTVIPLIALVAGIAFMILATREPEGSYMDNHI